MFTKTKTALSGAIALGTVSAPLTTYALAGNVYDSPDWVGPFYGSDAHRHSAVGNFEGNAHGATVGARGVQCDPAAGRDAEELLTNDGRGTSERQKVCTFPFRVSERPARESATSTSNRFRTIQQIMRWLGPLPSPDV
jgi:hypothetical protein